MRFVLLMTLALANAPARGDTPPVTPAWLQKRVGELHSTDPAVRDQAARAIEALPPTSAELLAQRLLTPRRTSVDLFRRMFLAIWAQVPNWKGYDPMWVRRPEPPWKAPPRVKGQRPPHRPAPHDPDAVDWLEALNHLDLSAPLLSPGAPIDDWTKPPSLPGRHRPAPRAAALPTGTPSPSPAAAPTASQLTDARAEALETVAILRALAHSQRMDMVEPMFALAFEYDGVFRDECGRQIRAMGSYAVPALIRLKHRQGPAGLHLSKQRRYASYQLDRMDRAQPPKAISSAPDDRVRAAIIHAYGETHALEAVDAILNELDVSSHQVRKEARWAWRQYVSGKAPPPPPMRKRKLTGGRQEEEEKPDYLTYRDLATLALQRQLQAIRGVPVDPKLSASALTDELFAYYDQRRAAEWDGLFAIGQSKEASHDWKGATDRYGWILAHDPAYGRRGEMAHAYVAFADELRHRGETRAALGDYRKAIALSPSGPQASYAGARVALLDGFDALAHGAPDPRLFERALALDPSLKEARVGLALALRRVDRQSRRRTGEALALGCGILLLLWVAWRRSAPSEPDRVA